MPISCKTKCDNKYKCFHHMVAAGKEETRHMVRRRVQYQRDGAFYANFISSFVWVMILLASGKLEYMPLAILNGLITGALLSLRTISNRRLIMEWLKRKLGLHYFGMKLDALAAYVKVKFIHVPEHMRCEPLKKQKRKASTA